MIRPFMSIMEWEELGGGAIGKKLCLYRRLLQIRHGGDDANIMYM